MRQTRTYSYIVGGVLGTLTILYFAFSFLKTALTDRYMGDGYTTVVYYRFGFVSQEIAPIIITIVAFVAVSLFLTALFFNYKKKRQIIATTMFISSVFLTVVMVALFAEPVMMKGYIMPPPPTPFCSPQVFWSSEDIENSTSINRLVVLRWYGYGSPPDNVSCRNISDYDFFARVWDDNWTKLQPAADGRYDSGQIMLSNAQVDLRWDYDERVTLSEPTPDWMTTPGNLRVKIIYKLTDRVVFEEGVFVS